MTENNNERFIYCDINDYKVIKDNLTGYLKISDLGINLNLYFNRYETNTLIKNLYNFYYKDLYFDELTESYLVKYEINNNGLYVHEYIFNDLIAWNNIKSYELNIIFVNDPDKDINKIWNTNN